MCQIITPNHQQKHKCCCVCQRDFEYNCLPLQYRDLGWCDLRMAPLHFCIHSENSCIARKHTVRSWHMGHTQLEKKKKKRPDYSQAPGRYLSALWELSAVPCRVRVCTDLTAQMLPVRVDRVELQGNGTSHSTHIGHFTIFFFFSSSDFTDSHYLLLHTVRGFDGHKQSTMANYASDSSHCLLIYITLMN